MQESIRRLQSSINFHSHGVNLPGMTHEPTLRHGFTVVNEAEQGQTSMISCRIFSAGLLFLWGLTITTQAIAQANLERIGDIDAIASAAPGTTLSVTNNSALAIDEEGNVGLAFLQSGAQVEQKVRGIGPDGSAIDYTASAPGANPNESPTLASVPGNGFILNYQAPDDAGELDFAVDVLQLETAAQPGAGSKTGELNWRQRRALELAIALRQATGCVAFRVGYVNQRVETVDAVLILNELDFVVGGYYTVHCSDGRNFVVYANYDTNPVTIERYALSNGPGGKGLTTPNAALPIVAAARRSEGSVALYAGQSEAGSVVTIAEFDDSTSPLVLTGVKQLTDNPLSFSSGPRIAACGHDTGFPHYWVVHTDDQDRAVLSRIERNTVDSQSLGPSLGPIDVGCDTWGNAVVGWSSADSGGSIQVVAVDRSGDIIDSYSEAAGSTFPGTVNIAVNAGGEVAVAWAIDNAEVRMRRYRLNGHFSIDGTLSGSYFATRYAGEGFAFDIVDQGGQPTLVIYYFTYQPDGSGKMNWLVGSAPIISNRAEVPVVTGAGATFGSGFDPNDVTLNSVGTVAVTFLSCRSILVDTQISGFSERHRYVAAPLSGSPLAVNGLCGDGPPGTAQVDASLGGSFFAAARAGEGFYFDVVDAGGTPTLVAFYFTYQPDGSGEPAWLIGSAPISGNRAAVPVSFGSGGVFGPDFDTASVTTTAWGTITVTWLSCTEVRIDYDGLWGTGSYTMGPLTGPLRGATGLCS